MSNGTANGRTLPGCSVLPPMNSRPAAASNEKTAEKPKRTAATSNRFQELNSFVDYSLVGLSRSQVLTWFVLWRDTKQSGTVRTSMANVARRIGASRRTVVDAVAKLKMLGLLDVIHRGGMDRGTNIYRVHPLIRPLG